ncbi:hypothetical protein [Micromonospora sp. CA-246542]|uniref:hypothetical protein n=1 Tax=Micromonospora sp. CA-246542 TaxID=3239959 RepID=UPI003D8DE74A
MSDIRRLLELAKSDPPPTRMTVDNVVTAGRQRARRRFVIRSTGVAGGVAAVVSAALIVTSSAPQPDSAATVGGPAAVAEASSTASARSPEFTATVSGYKFGDFEVTAPQQVTLGYQRSVIRRSNIDVGDGQRITVDAGALTVYQPGVFQPDRYRAGTTVRIGGRDGYETTLAATIHVGGPDIESHTNPKAMTVHLPALAWQYTDGAWATLESSDNEDRGVPAEILRQLAERFTTSGPAPVTLPFRLTYLPNGWQLAAAGRGRALLEGEVVAESWYAKKDVAFDSLTEPIDLETGKVPAIWVTVEPNGTEGPYRHPLDPPCGRQSCDIKIDSKYYAQVFDPSGTLSAAEIRRIADGVQFAALANPGTWYPAAR